MLRRFTDMFLLKTGMFQAFSLRTGPQITEVWQVSDMFVRRWQILDVLRCPGGVPEVSGGDANRKKRIFVFPSPQKLRNTKKLDLCFALQKCPATPQNCIFLAFAHTPPKKIFALSRSKKAPEASQKWSFHVLAPQKQPSSKEKKEFNVVA